MMPAAITYAPGELVVILGHGDIVSGRLECYDERVGKWIVKSHQSPEPLYLLPFEFTRCFNDLEHFFTERRRFKEARFFGPEMLYNQYQCASVHEPLLSALFRAEAESLSDSARAMGGSVWTPSRILFKSHTLPCATFDDFYVENEETHTSFSLSGAEIEGCALPDGSPLRLLSLVVERADWDREQSGSIVLAMRNEDSYTWTELASGHFIAGTGGTGDSCSFINDAIFEGALKQALATGSLGSPKTPRQRQLFVSSLHLAARGVAPGHGRWREDAWCQHHAHCSAPASMWHSYTAPVSGVARAHATELADKGLALALHPSGLDVLSRFSARLPPEGMEMMEAMYEAASLSTLLAPAVAEEL